MFASGVVDSDIDGAMVAASVCIGSGVVAGEDAQAESNDMNTNE
jgi:hypothetical protein